MNKLLSSSTDEEAETQNINNLLEVMQMPDGRAEI